MTAFDRGTHVQAAVLTARVYNQDFKDLSEKGIRDQVDNMKALKEVKLQAEKAELKVLKYKRLFHQVNIKLQEQSKLYMDQLGAMSESLDQEQLSHAQTKITLANTESQASDLNEMLELLQMKNESLQGKLMSQTALRSFFDKQWTMLDEAHRAKIGTKTVKTIMQEIPESDAESEGQI